MSVTSQQPEPGSSGCGSPSDEVKGASLATSLGSWLPAWPSPWQLYTSSWFSCSGSFFPRRVYCTVHSVISAPLWAVSCTATDMDLVASGGGPGDLLMTDSRFLITSRCQPRASVQVKGQWGKSPEIICRNRVGGFCGPSAGSYV